MSTDRTTELLNDVTKNFNPTDYRIKVSTSDNLLPKTANYAASQTDTIVVASPGAGKRIVIYYGSIRTSANSGEAYLEPTDDSFKMFQLYISVQNDFTVGNLYVPLPEDTGVKITSTQGANPLYVALNYSIESV